MAEGAILRDLVVLFATALPIVFIFQRLNVPFSFGVAKELQAMGC